MIRHLGIYPGERWPNYTCTLCDAMWLKPTLEVPTAAKCPGCDVTQPVTRNRPRPRHTPLPSKAARKAARKRRKKARQR